MNCIKCYQEIPDGAKFCPHCGAQQPEAEKTEPVQPMQAEEPTEPVQPAQAEEPTEPVQPAQAEEPTESIQQTQAEEPIQPKAASAENGYQEAQPQNPYTSAQNNSYYGAGQSYSDPNADQQYTGYQNQTSYQNQAPYQNTQVPQQPINWVPYLVLSIICTLCCCLPFGIVGIVYAAKINSAMAAGNYEEAKSAAKTAKIWIIASAVVGLVVEVIYIIFIFIGGAGGYYYY